MLRWAASGLVTVVVLTLAGCGGDGDAVSAREGSREGNAAAGARPAGGGPPAKPGPLRGGPPDAGTALGHGADAGAGVGAGARRDSQVEVPEVDRTPPETSLRVEGRRPGGGAFGGGGSFDIEATSARWPAGERVRLGAPALVARASARDEGGMARIRISIAERVTCTQGATGRRRVLLRRRYLPPPAIGRIRVPPGAMLPAERTRRARLRLGHGLCDGRRWRMASVSGRLYADATNAHERESSALVRFSYP